MQMRVSIYVDIRSGTNCRMYSIPDVLKKGENVTEYFLFFKLYQEHLPDI